MSGNQSKVDDKLRRLVREEVAAAIRPLRKQIAELKKELAGPKAGETGESRFRSKEYGGV